MSGGRWGHDGRLVDESWEVGGCSTMRPGCGAGMRAIMRPSDPSAVVVVQSLFSQHATLLASQQNRIKRLLFLFRDIVSSGASEHDPATGCLHGFNEGLAVPHNRLLGDRLTELRAVHPSITIAYADYMAGCSASSLPLPLVAWMPTLAWCCAHAVAVVAHTTPTSSCTSQSPVWCSAPTCPSTSGGMACT
ncbi:hypothetical protein ABZP36_011167 [Zizania latifolia]